MKIIAVIIIIGLSALWFFYLRPTSQQNESLVGIGSSNLNPYVQEFSLPAGSAPNGLVVDSQGIVWVASSSSNTLYRFDPTTERLQSYDIKIANSSVNSGKNSTMVWTMTEDKDGFIWLSQLGTKSIIRFDPVHEIFDKIQSDSGSPFQMKYDPYFNSIWFTTLSGNTIGVIQRNESHNFGYVVKQFDLGNGTAPAGLFVKDKSIWVSEITSQKIVQYNFTSQDDLVNNITKVAAIPYYNQTVLSSPTDLFVNGYSIWLTEHGTSFLTEYNKESDNVVRYPTSQNLFHATTLPFWIRGINDGNGLWFNEHEGNKLAFFDTVNKTMIEYNIPSRPKDGYLTYPLNIAIDPRNENVLWFSEWNTDKIGKINGQVQIPFSVMSDTHNVILSSDASKETIVNLAVEGQSPYSMNHVFINASSSISPSAGFVDVDAKISPDILDLSSAHEFKLLLRNYAALPGNYTLGINVSDGLVTKTIFLNLIVPKEQISP